MPSKDLHHSKHPKLNESLDLGKRGETTGAQRVVPAVLMRLADRLGVEPDTITKKIPAETLRRAQYPVLEERTEDGKTLYKEPSGIIEGSRIALVRK